MTKTPARSGVPTVLALVALLSVLTACGGEKVLVPPRFDLSAFERIGIIRLSVEGEPDLHELSTQKLIQAIQSAQPGTAILELGDEAQVLDSVGHAQLNAAAVRAIGEHHAVDAVFAGHLEVSSLKPKFNVSTLLTAMSAQADAEGALSVRLMETRGGATVWTGSAEGSAPVARLDVSADGPSHIGAIDPEKAYGKLVRGLVHRATWDLRPHYRRR